jgi:hypothetical protein
MTNTTLNPTNRVADYLGNGKASIKSVARENCVGKIVFVEAPIGTFGSGEYIVVEQTENALYGIKLGTAYDGHELKQIPLTGKAAWTVVRAESDTGGLIESTILLLTRFASTPAEDRVDLEDCIYEGAEYAADVLMRMLLRQQDERCRALVRELERIEQQATALWYGSGNSGADGRKTASDADGPYLVIVLGRHNGLDVVSVWLL